MVHAIMIPYDIIHVCMHMQELMKARRPGRVANTIIFFTTCWSITLKNLIFISQDCTTLYPWPFIVLYIYNIHNIFIKEIF